MYISAWLLTIIELPTLAWAPWRRGTTPPNREAVPVRLCRPAWREAPGTGRWGTFQALFFAARKLEAAKSENGKTYRKSHGMLDQSRRVNFWDKDMCCTRLESRSHPKIWTFSGEIGPRATGLTRPKTSTPPWREHQPSPAQVMEPERYECHLRSSQWSDLQILQSSNQMNHVFFPTISIWLVVDLPLWKIWKSNGIIVPYIWKNYKNDPNHQPNDVIIINHHFITIINH